MVVVSRCFIYGCVVIVKVLVLVMVIIIVKLLCFLFMNVTWNLNNFINSVAESIILTLVFLKGMASVNWDYDICISLSNYIFILSSFIYFSLRMKPKNRNKRRNKNLWQELMLIFEDWIWSKLVYCWRILVFPKKRCALQNSLPWK